MITGFHGKSMFGFIRNCWTVFQSGCIILHSHAMPRTQSMKKKKTDRLVFLKIKSFLLLCILTSIWCCRCSRFGPFQQVCSDILFSSSISWEHLLWSTFSSFHVCIYHLYIFLVRYLLGLFPILKSTCLFSYCWMLKVLCIF